MERIIAQFAHCIFGINTKEVHKHGLELNDLEKYLIAINHCACNMIHGMRGNYNSA